MEDYWSMLPDEISIAIFYMFPYRSQYMLSRVCKRWYMLIRTVGRVDESQAAQLSTLYVSSRMPDLHPEVAVVFNELATITHRFTFMSDPMICKLILEECYELMDHLDILDDAICRLYRVLDGRPRPPRRFAQWMAQWAPCSIL